MSSINLPEEKKIFVDSRHVVRKERPPNPWNVFSYAAADILQEDTYYNVAPNVINLKESYNKRKQAKKDRIREEKRKKKNETVLRDITKPKEEYRKSEIEKILEKHRFDEIRNFINEEYESYEAQNSYFSPRSKQKNVGEVTILGKRILPNKTEAQKTEIPRSYQIRVKQSNVETIVKHAKAIQDKAEYLYRDLEELKEKFCDELDTVFEKEYEHALCELGDLPYVLDQFELLPEFQEKREAYLKKKRENKIPDEEDELDVEEIAAEDAEIRSLLETERRLREWVWWFSYNASEGVDRKWIRKQYEKLDITQLYRTEREKKEREQLKNMGLPESSNRRDALKKLQKFNKSSENLTISELFGPKKKTVTESPKAFELFAPKKKKTVTESAKAFNIEDLYRNKSELH